MNRLMHYRIYLSTKREEMHLAVEDYKSFLSIFDMMYRLDRRKRKERQNAGIENAKEKGVYRGRKRKEIDPEFFTDIVVKFRTGEVSMEEALKMTGFSKSTFYRRMRENKEA